MLRLHILEEKLRWLTIPFPLHLCRCCAQPTTLLSSPPGPLEMMVRRACILYENTRFSPARWVRVDLSHLWPVVKAVG